MLIAENRLKNKILIIVQNIQVYEKLYFT